MFDFFIFAKSHRAVSYLRRLMTQMSLDISIKVKRPYCRLEASSAHEFALNATRPCYMRVGKRFLGRLRHRPKASSATDLISV